MESPHLGVHAQGRGALALRIEVDEQGFPACSC